MSTDESYTTVVVGGGQAGLAAGFFLSQQGQNFVILDGHKNVGDSWRRRWDSLRLFTPAKYDALPGLPFPAERDYLPTKDEVADYLRMYVEKFDLPVKSNAEVKRLTQSGEGFRIETGAHGYLARQVIIATGAYQLPRIPAFGDELNPAIIQLHSNDYRNPGQLPGGRILVVGAGNSGAEIAHELARAGREVWLSGRDVGHIPANTLGKYFDGRPYWWFISHILSIDTPLGRKMRDQVLHHGNPLIRSERKEILAVGIQPVARLDGVRSGKPIFQDGQSLEVDAVVWATGFRPDYHWIEMPIFDEFGFPVHQRGLVTGVRGMYFVGLHFQTALTSALLGGVGRDAETITKQIAIQ